MHVLVSGGLGYVGAAVAAELLRALPAHADVDVLEQEGACAVESEDLLSSFAHTEDKWASGRVTRLHIVRADLRDAEAVLAVLRRKQYACVVHLAALKRPHESLAQPLAYYATNVAGTVNLLAAMDATGVRALVFSSSAAVYTPQPVPRVHEGMPTGGQTPYGRSKVMCEQILNDWVEAAGHSTEREDSTDCPPATPSRIAISLRYFNVVGRVPGASVEPDGALMGALETAAHARAPLPVFGTDWPTVDGTGARDFVDVRDVARAHFLAFEYAMRVLKGRQGAAPGHSKGPAPASGVPAHVVNSTNTPEYPALHVFNVGTGASVTVAQVVAAASARVGRALPVEARPRRAGDLGEVIAVVDRARRHLGFQPRFTLDHSIATVFKVDT